MNRMVVIFPPCLTALSMRLKKTRQSGVGEHFRSRREIVLHGNLPGRDLGRRGVGQRAAVLPAGSAGPHLLVFPGELDHRRDPLSRGLDLLQVISRFRTRLPALHQRYMPHQSRLFHSIEYSLSFGHGSRFWLRWSSILPDIVDASGKTRHLAIGADKNGVISVVDRDSMGKFSATGNNIYQELDGALVRRGLLEASVFQWSPVLRWI